jgi:hypothetical protein
MLQLLRRQKASYKSVQIVKNFKILNKSNLGKI